MRDASLVLFIAAGIAASAGLAALWALTRHRDRGGSRASPATTVVASDTRVAPVMMLRDPEIGLRGRPDYVLRELHGDRQLLVALELKPNRRSNRVYESDAVQVAAYTLMLRAKYGDDAATFGYMRYPSGTVRVELRPALQSRVAEIAGAIRRDRRALVVHRSHDNAARCISCAMRSNCDERLA